MSERTIMLDRKRPIRFTRNSLVLAGNILHVPWEDIITHIRTTPPDLDKAMLFLWVALLDDDPKITLWDVKRLVTAAADRPPSPKSLALCRFPFLCNAALEECLAEGE